MLHSLEPAWSLLRTNSLHLSISVLDCVSNAIVLMYLKNYEYYSLIKVLLT